MPYTRAWNEATPAGTRAANQIDDAIRELKVDIRERMETTLVVDWDVDPVVAKPDISGAVTGKYLLFGPHGLQSQDDEDDTDYRNNHVEMEIGKTLYMDLVVPIGITITEFAATVDRMAAGTVTVKLIRQEFSTGVQTDIATVTRNVDSIGVTTSGVLAETTTNDRLYVVSFTSNNVILGSRFYGCRIKYNTPNSQAVI